MQSIENHEPTVGEMFPPNPAVTEEELAEFVKRGSIKPKSGINLLAARDAELAGMNIFEEQDGLSYDPTTGSYVRFTATDN